MLTSKSVTDITDYASYRNPVYACDFQFMPL